MTGNIVVSGNVDGRDLSTDGTKLDGIETGATADQTASEIVSLLSDQNIATTGTLGSNDITITGTKPKLVLPSRDGVYIKTRFRQAVLGSTAALHVT